MSALLETYAQLPFEVETGKGCSIFDTSGREYIDFYGGHAVCILGHGNLELAEKLKQQAEKLLFYSNVAKIELRERVAQKLLDFCNGAFSGVFFCNSGAEANENALKLAIQKTGRKQIISFEQGWHGRTLLAVNATDDKKWHESLPGWIGPVERITRNLLDDLERIDESCAAVILEPVQSIAGMCSFSESYLEALRKRCDEVGAWLIFDEVQTGVGRLGVPYVAAHGFEGNSKVTPDISTSAKSLGNGVPVGAMLVNDAVAAKVGKGDLGSTFGGGPLALTAVEFVLDQFKENKLLEKAAHIGRTMKTRLSEIEQVKEVRGFGALLGIELETEARPVHAKLLEKGFIAGTSGHVSTLRVMPPVILTEKMISDFSEALKEIL